MRPALVAVAARQGWIFTRSQALRAGYTDREIKALTRPDGEWAVVRRGTYCERALLAQLDARARWMLKDRAAALSSRRPAVLSHDSAARLLAIDTLDPPSPASHLTLYGPRGTRTNSGLTRHRDLQSLCVQRVGDLVATSYARTAIDIARWHGYRHGLVAIDSARQLGVPYPDFEAELERMRHHPHIAQARAALADSDAGAESVLETLGRELVASLDIGVTETQFAVRLTGGRTVWCDIRVGRHLFECEGRLKLVPVEEGGVASESADAVVWKQQARRTDICAEGFGMSRIVWADCFGPARDRARDRLRREYDVTEARFGREPTPQQSRFAQANPRRRSPRLWVPDVGTAA
ncbi:hypothetical protein EXE59_06405 [Nocardioides eburneiflavus]|uniref:Type IV toxin-antitoxin system AbiEi family antitoxin domain-containing protein n=1 Tax=Nocardioides eburneiflavus TaxID=2518372 RepID=A0A4Z1CJL7_9ACTN|nr:type IV toxin-antitoxin system AbiEi family antitoxin domain-containing protein [Nocardioides eburneiflavus]TGN63620.1 hypothetical protein EXE59_06405 [Nocardioides eburneiflavus]